MAREVFTDTSGLYALADRRNASHGAAERCVSKLVKAGARLVVTDYIIDEACTLAKARVGAEAAVRLLEIVERSEAFRMVWIGEERFDVAKAFFRKHSDHGYSFTDCTSFVVMQELRLTEALTTDGHFQEAGFRCLLPVA